jgi:arsenite-transporting ATPase
MLRELGRAVFGDADPTGFFFRGRPYVVRRDEDGFVLELQLPFASRESVRLTRFGDELVVGVGSWRRNLILPRILVDRPTLGAKFDDHTLTIRFGDPDLASVARSGQGAAGEQGNVPHDPQESVPKGGRDDER